MKIHACSAHTWFTKWIQTSIILCAIVLIANAIAQVAVGG